MVREAIIYRTGEHATLEDALLTAYSYTILIFGLVALLFAERSYWSDIQTRLSRG